MPQARMRTVGAKKSIGSVGLSARHHGAAMIEFLTLLVAVSPAVVRGRARDTLFWTLVRLVRHEWRRHLVLVRPETVVGWHRRGRRLVWRWTSRARFGRP